MYESKYPKLKVERMIEILRTLDPKLEISNIEYMNKDCQEIENRNANNFMLLINEDNGEVFKIDIEE